MFSPWNASSSCNLLLSKPITLPDLKFWKGSVLSVVSSDLMAIWPSDIGRPFKHLISKCPHCFARSLVIWPDPQPTSTTCCGSPAWDIYKNSHSKIIIHIYILLSLGCCKSADASSNGVSNTPDRCWRIDWSIECGGEGLELEYVLL